MCSIAATSSPLGSWARHVSRAPSRRRCTNASAAPRLSNGTNARHIDGRAGTTRRVTSVMTPSVPSDPMNKSMRSMPGAAK
jgi:hypothetical protein